MRALVLAVIAAALIAALASQGLPLGEFAIYVGAIVLLVLAVRLLARGASWLLSPAGRPCPRCGERVANGVLDCQHCGFDFRSIGTTDAQISATLSEQSSAPATMEASGGRHQGR